MNYTTLQITTASDQPGVQIVTLHRPDAMNAMNTRMFEELGHVFREAAHQAELRCVVLTGSGARAFSVGADLKERNGMSDATWRAQHQVIEEAFLLVHDCPIPVIAALEGHAHGGGLELALMCDFIIAGDAATCSLPEVRRGILPGGGGVQNLVRRAGMARAKQLLFTGGRFDAAQGLAMQVFNEVTPAGQALTRALAIAGEIVASAPMSVRYLKLASGRGGEVDFHTGYALDIAAYNVLVGSADRHEGVAAFNEKRVPQWQNR